MTTRPASPTPASAGDRMRELSPAEFERIAAVLQAEAGIELTEGKLPLVHSRLSGRLRSLGLQSYRAYCDYVESAEGQGERLEMLSVLTTNVTRFFREPHHFDYLRKDLIPDLTRVLRRGGKVRAWSAGCASGEEPYSLALTFLENVPDISRLDFRILATDIDPAILRQASAGLYSGLALSQVPAEQKAAYFRPCPSGADAWEVGPEIRGLVTFRRLNLIGSWPFNRPFDLIMCRNVVIYFGADTKATVWSRLVGTVRPGGWLITGHSERLSDEAAADMEPLYTTTYRRRDPNSPSKGTTQWH